MTYQYYVIALECPSQWKITMYSNLKGVSRTWYKFIFKLVKTCLYIDVGITPMLLESLGGKIHMCFFYANNRIN